MRLSPTLPRRFLHGWLLLVLAGLVVTGGMAASAAWRAIAAHRAAAAPDAPPQGYEADDHFPGAALLYLDDTPPPPGATGTIKLPPVPATASITAADAGIVPARPFAMAGASGVDRARAAECLTDAIYYEAASEPDAGQRAVAQVVLNRVRHPAFPATVCGVVFQGSQARGCQFSFACDGAMARVPAPAAWTRAARVAAAALAGYVYAPVGLATHYHTYAVTPAWNRTLVMTAAIGAHLFHRWKGYWGTAAAFTQAYAGDEPLPGPLRAVVEPVVTAVNPPAPLAPLPASRTAAAVPASPDDHLPPASQVLDKWKDSGKPL